MTYGMLTVELRDGRRGSRSHPGAGELLDELEHAGYLRAGLYWFDGSGEWTYAKREWDALSDLWVMARVS